MSKVNKTIVEESRSVTLSSSLSTGGFVELELPDRGKGYLKVHVSSMQDSGELYSFSQSWRWIKHCNRKTAIKVLKELHEATSKLLESIEVTDD